MRSAAAQYLALVHLGRNQVWRYLLGIFIIIVFLVVPGALPYLWLTSDPYHTRLAAFIELNLGFVSGLAGVAVAVVLVHRRALKSLVTPRSRIDWRRAAQGFAVWFALSAAATLLEALLFPERYTLTFNPETFLLFAFAVLCLTPLQTTVEELLFRGYLMQALSLLTARPLLIVVFSSVLFMLPHLANPEVEQHPLLVSPQYLVIGLLLAAITLRDGRLELAIGIHAANNVYAALISNYEESVFATDAIFGSRMDPVYSLLSLVVMSVASYLILFRHRARIAA